MSYKISLSVHQLVDFVLRSGDIDTRIFNNATMLEGTKIHRYYQTKMDSSYQSEVFLSYDFLYDEFDVHIEGRADGIIVQDELVIIDEIKSCVGNLQEFHNKNENWHLGQAKVYGFLYCKKYGYKKINVVLTYISQIDKSDVQKYFYSYTFDELELFFNDLLYQYFEWHRLVQRHKIDVRSKTNLLKFPYKNMNLYQQDLIDFVKNIEELQGKRGLIEAPTGIGKTISTIFPSIKNLKKYDRIFYLTAKNSGKAIVDETLNNIFQNDSGMKSVIITAKDKICPLNEVVCNPDECPFAKGYYDKLHKALLDSFYLEKSVYNLDFFKEAMEKYEICPFEFQLDLSLFCDLIIGDYNYVFDPFVHIQRYMENDISNTLLLVDEGHNLLDRCRAMYSISFSLNDIKETRKSLRHLKNSKIKNNLKKLEEYFNDIVVFVDENNVFEVLDFEENFIKLLNKFHENYTSLSLLDSKKITKEYKSLFQQINKFLKLLELINEENFFKKYFKKLDEDINVSIYCLSPTKYINSLTKQFKNSILFSATLSPINYYNELFFNGDEEVEIKQFDSPFDSSRLNINISNSVSIKYKDRVRTLNTVISQIVAFVTVKKGNYFIFVPSYEYLKLLKDNLVLDSVDVFYQQKEMKEKDRDVFIKQFTSPSEKSKVGICVLGGSFSESINLVGETLIGVIIIGVGVPSISFENNALKNYYDSIGLNGFYYSYIIPGMKNVVQSVGRLIRSKSDYGSVLLIDERYEQINYRKLFRKEWKNIKNIKNDYEIIENLNIFYKKILNQ